MRVYGSDICIDCRNYRAIQAARGFLAEFIDITACTPNLREFLAIRDTAPLYEAVRGRHGIGIPLFVREDGSMTFDMDEALAWIGEPPVREEEIGNTGTEAYPCNERTDLYEFTGKNQSGALSDAAVQAGEHQPGTGNKRLDQAGRSLRRSAGRQ